MYEIENRLLQVKMNGKCENNNNSKYSQEKNDLLSIDFYPNPFHVT